VHQRPVEPARKDPTHARSKRTPKGTAEDRQGQLVSVDPTAESCHRCQTRWCESLQRLHTPTPGILAGQARRQSGQHGGPDPNFLTYSARSAARSCSLNAFAQVTGLRARTVMLVNDGPFRYPHQVCKKGLRPRFRWSEALSHTWWQVKDSNLRSFRDGFTVPRPQARDQRKCLTRNNFRAHSQ